MLRLSFYHNNQGQHKWNYGSKVSQKSFNSISDAISWIENNNNITPLKLLAWSDDIDCYETIKDFR